MTRFTACVLALFLCAAGVHLAPAAQPTGAPDRPDAERVQALERELESLRERQRVIRRELRELRGDPVDADDDIGAIAPDQPLPPEAVERVMAFIAEHRPGLHERMERLRETDPATFDRLIRRRAEDVRRMLEQRAEDPQLFELRRAVFEAERDARITARRMRSDRVSDAQRETLRAELRGALERGFEARIALEEYEIASHRRRLEERQRRVVEAKSQRDELIDERVRKLIAGEFEFPGERFDGRGPRGPRAGGDGHGLGAFGGPRGRDDR
jgi:hypothetical protein